MRMSKRTTRILICFSYWLLPVVGIYFGFVANDGTFWDILGTLSLITLLPLSGALFSAITNDRTLFINVFRPWEHYLGQEEKRKKENNI